MKKTLIFSLLIVTLAILPLFSACGEPSSTKTLTWKEMGEPQYGGRITISQTGLDMNFDNMQVSGGPMRSLWYEFLLWQDWTFDRNTFDFRTMWTPSQYFTGFLAESFEWSDSQTLIFHLREGVHWQDKPPVNGREFTADDVEYHFDRILGTGSGFTEPEAIMAQRAAAIQKVTALDRYTVEVKFKNPTFVVNLWCMLEPPPNQLEAPEITQQGIDITDWKNTVGTGAFILTDYVAGSSMTLSKNPNYWGYDERHPQNRLPYIDELKVVCIPDTTTRTAALRTGEIDMKCDEQFGWQQAEVLAEGNPELMQSSLPQRVAMGIGLRVDRPPFDDIRVRKALQLATDRKNIAENYFGGTADWQPFGVTSPAYGMGVPYDEWPQELQEEYSYNPDKARDLLAEAGYPDGFKTNIVCGSNQDLDYLQILKAEFLEIGVDMEIKTFDGPAMMDFLNSGKHDAMFTANAGNPYLPPYMVMGLFLTDSRENTCFHSDTHYDVLFEKFENAADVAEAEQAAKEVDKYYLEQHWLIPAYSGSSYYFWQPYVKGYSGEYLFWIQGPYYARFWVDQELKQSMGH